MVFTSGVQVPLTPPQVANWIYQASTDVASELNKLLASADFDKHGHAKGDGKGEVMLWWRSHLGSARDQGFKYLDQYAELAVVHVPGCDAQQVWHSAEESIRHVGATLHAAWQQIELARVILCVGLRATNFISKCVRDRLGRRGVMRRG